MSRRIAGSGPADWSFDSFRSGRLIAVSSRAERVRWRAFGSWTSRVSAPDRTARRSWATSARRSSPSSRRPGTRRRPEDAPRCSDPTQYPQHHPQPQARNRARGIRQGWFRRAMSSWRDFGPALQVAWASTTRRCVALKHDIICVSLSGFGQTGPYAQVAGHDINYQAMAGNPSFDRRQAEGPPRIPGNAIADNAGGIAAALRDPDRRSSPAIEPAKGSTSMWR